jgi:hypothetical protein
MSSITISLSSTSRHSKRLQEPLGDVTNAQQSKRGRTSTRDGQTSTPLLGKKIHLERWVPETDLLEELSISQAEQSLHSARIMIELMLRTNKIPFVRVSKGQAKPSAPFSQLSIKGYYYLGSLGSPIVKERISIREWCRLCVGLEQLLDNSKKLVASDDELQLMTELSLRYDNALSAPRSGRRETTGSLRNATTTLLATKKIVSPQRLEQQQLVVVALWQMLPSNY